MMLVSVCGYSNPRGTHMVMASVCWFCAMVLMLLTRLEAMSRQEGEVCCSRLVFSVNGFVTMI